MQTQLREDDIEFHKTIVEQVKIDNEREYQLKI